MNSESINRVLGILRRNRWFADLPDELQLLIVHRSIVRKSPKKYVAMHEDSAPKGMYAVLQGQVALTRRISDDQTFFYYLGGPGFWFGDTASLTKLHTLVSVTARTELEYLFLPIDKIDAILEARPLFYRHFVKLPLERSHVMIRSLAQAHTLAPEASLRARLADVCDLIGLDGVDSEEIELSMSQTDLAQMIGCSRQTMNGLLQELEKQGLIRMGFGKVFVLDKSAFHAT